VPITVYPCGTRTIHTAEEVRTDYHLSVTERDENGMPTSHCFPVYNITHSTLQSLVKWIEGNPNISEVATEYL